jgi:hypothetical protein
MASLLDDSLAAHDSYQEGGFGEEYLEATGGSLVEGGPPILRAMECSRVARFL